LALILLQWRIRYITMNSSNLSLFWIPFDVFIFNLIFAISERRKTKFDSYIVLFFVKKHMSVKSINFSLFFLTWILEAMCCVWIGFFCRLYSIVSFWKLIITWSASKL
jgi:hypothetical protein